MCSMDCSVVASVERRVALRQTSRGVDEVLPDPAPRWRSRVGALAGAPAQICVLGPVAQAHAPPPQFPAEAVGVCLNTPAVSHAQG